MPEKFTVTLEQQIAELKAEIALRQNVFPTWIVKRRMTREKADQRVAAMKAALHTLLDIKKAIEQTNAEAENDAAAMAKACEPRTEEGLEER